MKKILSALSFLLVAGAASAQWTPVQTPVTHNLYDIFFANPLTGYCVGDSGTVLKSVDGGASWNLLPSFTNELVEEVYFKNADTGWVKTPASVYQTTNGGSSFQSLEPVFANPDSNWNLSLTRMSFRGNTGIITGYFLGPLPGFNIYSKITHDGGRNWSAITLPGDYFTSAKIVTDSVFYAADFELYKTQDGGMTWQTLPNGQLAFPPINNKCFQVFDTAGNGVISMSYHLDYVRLQSTAGSLQIVPQAGVRLLSNLSFPNRDTGYALQQAGGLYHLCQTTDGGVSYGKLTTDSLPVLNLTFLDTQTGFLCGEGGKIYKISNGGAPTAVAAVPEKDAFSVYPNPAKGTLFLKTNGASIQSLALADISGKVVRTFPEAAETLDISGMAPGAYLLLIETKDQLLRRKIVLE